MKKGRDDMKTKHTTDGAVPLGSTRTEATGRGPLEIPLPSGLLIVEAEGKIKATFIPKGKGD